MGTCTHSIVYAPGREHAAFFEYVRVCSEAEEEEETYGCLEAPELVEDVFMEGKGRQIAEAEEGEEDGYEGCSCRGLVEVAGSWLQRVRSLLEDWEGQLSNVRVALTLPAAK